MPARTRKARHDDLTRARIQTSQLVNRLTAHVFGKAEMSPTQVRAAEVLLKKTLPDLSAADNKVEHLHSYVSRMPEKASDATKWQQQHAPTIQ